MKVSGLVVVVVFRFGLKKNSLETGFNNLKKTENWTPSTFFVHRRTVPVYHKKLKYSHPKCSKIQFLAKDEGEEESPEIRLLPPSSETGLQLWNEDDNYSRRFYKTVLSLNV